MYKCTVYLSIFILFSLCTNAQRKLSCKDIHNGIFYCYSKNSADSFLVIRQGDIGYEKNLNNADTSTWKITWLNDCRYSMKYITGNSQIAKDNEKLLKHHQFVYDILACTDDYYIFKGYLDKVSNLPIQTDTMWLHEKTTATDHQYFTQVTDTTFANSTGLSDTSKYALLYIYRQHKIPLGLTNYAVYFNDDLFCILKNNSGCIFKILKEGQFILSSRLLKEKASVAVDVKFGNVYYIKSSIIWGIYNWIYNYKLAMAVVNNVDGEKEFDAVKNK